MNEMAWQVLKNPLPACRVQYGRPARARTCMRSAISCCIGSFPRRRPQVWSAHPQQLPRVGYQDHTVDNNCSHAWVVIWFLVLCVIVSTSLSTRVRSSNPALMNDFSASNPRFGGGCLRQCLSDDVTQSGGLIRSGTNYKCPSSLTCAASQFVAAISVVS